MIKKLNYNERITLTLYYVEKFTTKEISKILKEPESTIKNRILRAKNKLRKIGRASCRERVSINV